MLENILLYNSTGLGYDLGAGFHSEVKFVSAVTLGDVLTPFDQVDLLEADIQHSEINVFPPFIDLLTGKVRRVHIGTHGSEAHELLRALFIAAGWELVFDYSPETRHMTEQGPLDLIQRFAPKHVQSYIRPVALAHQKRERVDQGDAEAINAARLRINL